jgi:pimeloyl-ACP methyl ester carboxylesterase
VLQVDLPGFGRSPNPPDGEYGPLHQAESVLQLIREKDLKELTLVGHSLGGGVALLTAMRLLEEGVDRVRRIVVVAGAAYDQKLPPFVALARWPRLSGALLRVLGTRAVVRRVLQSIVFDPSVVTRDWVEGYAAPLDSAPARHALVATALAIRPPDLAALTARYAELRLPTLLVWGRHDRVTPLWIGERLASELPHARLTVLEACGHMPCEECPEESFGHVERFLADG